MNGKTSRIFLLAAIIFIILVFAIKMFGQEYPKPIGYVNDFAKVMTVGEQKALQAILADYEKKSTIEIAIVTIDSLNGQSIEEYTVGLAQTWGVGKKGKDNGLVILNSIKDRKWRIEVGYGLEEFVTDAYGATLGDEFLTPLLKQGKYYEAYKGAVEKIMKDFGNLTDEDKERLKDEKEGGFPTWLIILIIIIVFLIILDFVFNGGDALTLVLLASILDGSGKGGGGSSFGGGGFGGGGSSGSY